MKNSTLFATLAVNLCAVVGPAQTPDLYDEFTLRTIELSFSQSNWWQQLGNNYSSQTYLQADMTVDGVSYPGVGVRFKGNSSYSSVRNSPKKPFNIDVDAFNPGQELYGYEKVILNNGYKDPTFCREVVAYRVMRQYLPASKANWLRLVINGESWGLYMNIQHVGSDFMDEWFEEDGGNRYKAIPGSGSTLTWLGNTPSQYQRSYELKSENNPAPWTDLINLCNVLNNTPQNQLSQALPPVLSVERALWMIATTNVLCQGDAYFGTGHNYYVMHDDHHDQMNTIAWDLNSSFGAFSVMNLTYQQKVNLDPFHGTRASRPLLSRMMAIGDVRHDYLAHIRTLLDEQYDWAVLGPLTTQYRNFIDAEVQADPKKLYSYQLFQQNFSQDVVLPAGSPGANSLVPGLQSFVTARRSFLTGHPDVNRPAPDIQQVGHSPAQPTASEVVWVNATVTGPSATVGGVSLHYRVLGAFAATPMFDDGQHNDGAAGDDVWGASITSQAPLAVVEYYVRANSVESAGGAAMLSPRSPEHAPYSYLIRPGSLPDDTVKINEFVAKNNTGIQDEAGEYEDWLELVNVTASPIVVSNMYLTDNIANPTKWQIPEGNVLNPGDTMLVWCDEDAQNGPLHANFKLSASGEELALIDRDGATPLDYIEFGPQVADIATGRLFDGLDPWVTFSVPTPEALNALAGCGVRAYSALDPAAHTVSLGLSAPLTVGAMSNIAIAASPPNALQFGLISLQPGYVPVTGSGVALLLGPPGIAVLFQAASNSAGQLGVPFMIPGVPAFAGLSLYLQVVSVDGAGALVGSNALEAIICP